MPSVKHLLLGRGPLQNALCSVFEWVHMGVHVCVCACVDWGQHGGLAELGDAWPHGVRGARFCQHPWSLSTAGRQERASPTQPFSTLELTPPGPSLGRNDTIPLSPIKCFSPHSTVLIVEVSCYSRPLAPPPSPLLPGLPGPFLWSPDQSHLPSALQRQLLL